MCLIPNVGNQGDCLRRTKMETTQNTGLAVMRMQPMHNGHYELISKMMKEMDTVIIGLGSIQETHTTSNPYTPK